MIFMDYYMSGVARCRLGTETVRELRTRRADTTIIAGLNANDLESAFIEAFANAFTIHANQRHSKKNYYEDGNGGLQSLHVTIKYATDLTRYERNRD
jgi:CheY-like chemotaxis protein